MRVILVLVLSFLVGSAVAREHKPQTDPASELHPEMSFDAQALKTVQALTKQLESAGFKDVQILPSAVLVEAKDGSGEAVMLIVDVETMTVVQLEKPAAPNQRPRKGGQR